MIKQKIKKILVALDGSKNSFKGLDEAIYIARQCGATITGFHVVSVYDWGYGDILDPLKGRLFEQAEKYMVEAKTISAQNGIVFNKKIIYGDATSDIPSFAREKKFDLVVIGSRGLGRAKEVLLGSVAYAIVHKSKVPVLVVK